ncbi:MAG: FAD:protein FMN transferase [Planctomycetota bacterium]|jgi:thiamine biosynthesis lipoprotein
MDKQNRWVAPAIIIGAFVIAGLYFFVWPTRRIQADSGHQVIMGTFARIIAIAKTSGTANKCIKAGFEQLESVDNLMSGYKTDSQLSRLNKDAYKAPVKVDQSLFEVLQRSVAFSRKTDGAFDITIGPLVDLYRRVGEEKIAPSDEQITRAKSKVGFEKLKLDEQNKTVKFTVDGMKLDLGAIAKGYAIDKAVEAMQTCRAIGGMIDIGGDIRCFGTPPRGKTKWLIGLQDPTEKEVAIGTNQLLLKLELTDNAVATSGDYRRFTLIDGKKYSHIINRRTGSSAAGLSSVTIISRNATDADALATAVSVMGAEKGLTLIEKIPQTEAILIPASAGMTSHPGENRRSSPNLQRIQTTGAEKYIHKK